jgi:branched-chain amino acid transport system permease protein
MAALAIALLDGLSYASTLFLVAAGLTLIFGVTRIVNFAHGSFFMLGALFAAHWLVDWFPAWADNAWLYACAMALGALCAALAGALAEVVLLRRLYGVPELYQLVATFGLTLAMHDGMRWIFGPDEVFAPRFPGLKGSIAIGDGFFPTYQLLTIALGPLLWAVLHGTLHHTRWGVRLRAATLDRDMLSALGVSPRPLMLIAVALGCALAGLGGALQLPREPANLQMDMNIIVETFVVVVTGGLGSVGGAFLAALLIGQVHSLGTALMPQATLVLVFVTMGLVLALRPQGLAGTELQPVPHEQGIRFGLWPRTAGRFWWLCAGLVGLAALAWSAGPYWQSLCGDVLILVIVGVSLQAMMALGALVSFGHAAFFGLGAYVAAWVHLNWGGDLGLALLAASVSGLCLAALAGLVLVRRSGVYLAMLSLALAQVLWAMASQWSTVTGGDNGLIGLQLVAQDGRPAFYALHVLLAIGAIALLRRFVCSPLGAAVQAVRDAPLRAAASGLPLYQVKWTMLVLSATMAGLAGGLFAAHKGSVFPSVLGVSTSVDILLVVLLGGMHQLWGSVAGALVLVVAGSAFGRGFDYWRGALGLLVMVIMVWAPSGLLGLRRALVPRESHG